MNHDTVETLMFCQWNERVLSENTSYPWINESKIIEDQTSGLLTLRSLKKKVWKLIASLPAFQSDTQIIEANRTARRFASEAMNANPSILQSNHRYEGDTMTVETTSGGQDQVDTSTLGNVAFNAARNITQATPGQITAPHSAQYTTRPLSVLVPQTQSGVFSQVIGPAPAGGSSTWFQPPLIFTPQPMVQSMTAPTGIPALGLSIGYPAGLATNTPSGSQMIYSTVNYPNQHTQNPEREESIQTPRKRPRHESN